jgi:transcriptional regulator with XRE-family HTH domain
MPEVPSVDDGQPRRVAAGAELRAWRAAQGLTMFGLCTSLAARVGEGLRPDPSQISRWEGGQRTPPGGYLDALAELGAPVGGWRSAGSSARGAAPSSPSDASDDGGDDPAVVEVQRLLQEGRPLGEIYTVASRALASSVTRGLSVDRQRAWSTLLRALRDGAAERGRMVPLEAHPDWAGAIDMVLEAILPFPGAIDALLAALGRHRALSEKASGDAGWFRAPSSPRSSSSRSTSR